ncbi:hypothetical protein LCGC14_2121620, partial [marine sediment metagenome]
MPDHFTDILDMQGEFGSLHDRMDEDRNLYNQLEYHLLDAQNR